MPAHSAVSKKKTDKEFVASQIRQRGNNQDQYSSVSIPRQRNLSLDIDSEELASLSQTADDLIEGDFLKTPTKQDVITFKDQFFGYVTPQMAFTRTLTDSNSKLCQDYANLSLNSPRLNQIELDLEANSRSLKNRLRKTKLPKPSLILASQNW